MNSTILAKRFALALPLLAAAGAQAQNVTVYGAIDTGIDYVTHVAVAGVDTGAMFRMPNLTGTTPSRIGFRGTEDLGGGLKAGFVVENGFATDTGNMNYGARLFGREANISLSGAFGTVYLGRQYTMTAFAWGPAEVMGPAQYGASTIDPYMANARADNAIGYIGKFNGFVVGATYSMGRDGANNSTPGGSNCAGEVATDHKACREWSAMLKYEMADGMVSASRDEIRGNVGATIYGLVNSSDQAVRTTLNGFYKVRGAKLAAGWLRKEQTASTGNYTADQQHVDVSYPLDAWVLDGQFGHFTQTNIPGSARYIALRAAYNFSKRTAIYAQGAYVVNSGMSHIPASAGLAVANGVNQAGIMVGIRHLF
jgi:predicted porin